MISVLDTKKVACLELLSDVSCSGFIQQCILHISVHMMGRRNEVKAFYPIKATVIRHYETNPALLSFPTSTSVRQQEPSTLITSENRGMLLSFHVLTIHLFPSAPMTTMTQACTHLCRYRGLLRCVNDSVCIFLL